MHDCPICATPTDNKAADTPYWECPRCFVWFQDPMPPKLYQGPTEYDLEEMPESDKQVNRDLAQRLFTKVMRGKAGRTLDIGCKHPVLSAALATLECEAHAIDGVAPVTMPDVDCEAGDFESDEQVCPHAACHEAKFRLITMIHVFEHMYDPLVALRKLRALVEDDGRVFLRLPDRRVSGFERDLTAHHYSIHPYFHALTSILEALYQVRDCFVIESTYAFAGAGQRDIVLRPISKAPTLGIAMIAKNEERDIGRAVQSFAPIADMFALADTGSTDQTVNVARSAIGKGKFRHRKHTKASEWDGKDWLLWDFSAARNASLKLAEDTGVDWLLWVDADDELATPQAIKRVIYWPEFDYFGCWIESGGQRWIQQRLWKADKHIRFKGRCHEYAVIDGLAGGQIDESLIVHHAEPTQTQENSNPRNERILLREWAEEQTPRTSFYLANTYRDSGRHEQAVEWYAKRIAFGIGFRDEYLFAMLYRARCLRLLKRFPEAASACYSGLATAADWHEFTMELAFGAYDQGKHSDAIGFSMTAMDKTPSETPLWREASMYRDQPLRLISWCHEAQGNLGQAVEFAEQAAVAIGGPDQEWEMRTRRLRAQFAAKDAPPPAKIVRKRPRMALHRPGAIGDVLMTLNLVPALREANPDAEIAYFCSPEIGDHDALGTVMLAAGVDLIMDHTFLPQWRAQCERVIDLIGYPLAEGYPEKPMARHLLEYFGVEMGLLGVREATDGTPPFNKMQTIWADLPSLTLPRPARPVYEDGWPKGDYITLQNVAGWSSYKEWPVDRWHAVAAKLQADLGVPVIWLNKEAGLPLRESIALFANARMHLGIDSFCNHLTNYNWTDARGGRKVPGVILWGSTQVSASGYAHNINISKGLHCQPCFREDPKISRMPRGVCINPMNILSGDPMIKLPREYGDMRHQCMADISVDEVVAAAMELWERTA